MVNKAGVSIDVAKLAPHDLRRTFAKLAHKGRAALEQIQLSLGHSSITTTERYLGVRAGSRGRALRSPRDHGGRAAMMECPTPPKNRVGRPRVGAMQEQVRALRNEGISWRQIAKALKIGATTVRRLFSSGEEIHK